MEKLTNKSDKSMIPTPTTSKLSHFVHNADVDVRYKNIHFDTTDETLEEENDSEESNNIAERTTKNSAPTKIPQMQRLNVRCDNVNANPPENPQQKIDTKAAKDGWELIKHRPKGSYSKVLNNFVQNHMKPNVQIRIGAMLFNCHLMVLKCYSEYFTQYTNDLVIQLPEDKISPAAFVMVYEWMLADSPKVQRKKIVELLKAAHFLQIKGLLSQCWTCLDNDGICREDAAFFLYLEARDQRMENLQQVMLARIRKFFLTLVCSKEFVELSAEEVCNLLGSNTIGVNSEIEIFMSAVRWLSNNWSERESSVMRVMKCVRFCLMPSLYLVSLSKSIDCPIIDRIVSHPEVKQMICDAICYTTAHQCYSKNPDGLAQLLERCHLTAPKQRQWVFDRNCNYHHPENFNKNIFTYENFMDYLILIQNKGKNYWRQLEILKGVEPSASSFLQL